MSLSLLHRHLSGSFQAHIFFFSFIFISWRIITLQYCSGFCLTLTWISHGFTCILTMPPTSLVPSYRSREASWFITSALFLAGVINKNYQLLLYFKPSVFSPLPSALPSTCHGWVSGKFCRANPLTSQWHTPTWALRSNRSVLQDQLSKPSSIHYQFSYAEVQNYRCLLISSQSLDFLHTLVYKWTFKRKKGAKRS